MKSHHFGDCEERDPRLAVVGWMSNSADGRASVLFLTNMERANLAGTDFSGAKLVFVNLGHANLTNADISGSTLFGVNVSGVTWSNTTCPDATNSNADGGTCVGHL